MVSPELGTPDVLSERDSFISTLGEVIISHTIKTETFPEFNEEQRVAIGSVLIEKIAVWFCGRTYEEKQVEIKKDRNHTILYDPLEAKWTQTLLGTGIEDVSVLDRIDSVKEEVMEKLMNDPKYLYRE